MEQSRLISSVIAKLKIAYPYYFKELKTEELAGMISMYQEELSGYNELTLMSAVRSLIRKNKFMPSIHELIQECEKSIQYEKNSVLERMKDDAYFKRGPYGELDNSQSTRNYEKALMWVELGTIPDWLLEDMRLYGYSDNRLINHNYKALGGGQ